MNFHVIGPLAAKELFRDHSYHMALAQYLYNEDYFLFMQDQCLRGATVILDSGVYEGSAVDDRQLLYWCKKLLPYAVILPDKPHDMQETLKRSLKFAQLMDDHGFDYIKKWKVLHATSSMDFDLSYTYDSRLFDGVCFSRLTKDYGWDRNRPDYIKYLQTKGLWNSSCYHHALGMKDGSLRELQELVSLGVNSIDSSAPIWRGLHNLALSHTPFPFDIPFNPFYVDTINSQAEANLKQVLSICESK